MSRLLQPPLFPGIPTEVVADTAPARTLADPKPIPAPGPERMKATIHDPHQIDLEEALRAKRTAKKSKGR